MKKNKNIFSIILILFIIFLPISTLNEKHISSNVEANSTEGTWFKSSNGKWWYKFKDGNYAVGWEYIDNEWYYFDEDGWMLTGWIKLSGKWYYLRDSGKMATGWLKDSGSWYYLYSDGSMAKGWIRVDNRWYYLLGSGRMVTGYQRIDNIDYNFNLRGELVYSGDLLVTVLGVNYNKFNESDYLNTNLDVYNVKDIFNNSNYTVQAIDNAKKSDVFSINSYINQKNINSGLFIFSGHGSKKGNIYFANNEYLNFDSISKENLNNTSVAFFFNCYGAYELNGNSIVDSAIKAGASASYGYDNLSYSNEDFMLQKSILNSMLEGKTLYESVAEAKALHSQFVVVRENRIVIKGNVDIKLPKYRIIKSIREELGDVISKEDLKKFKIKNGVGNRYYRGILTTDSFGLDKNNKLISYNLDLLNSDLSVLDSIIDQTNEGKIYDDIILKKIKSEEQINSKYSFISKINNKLKLIRSYYISSGNNQIVKRISIDVETGNELSEFEIKNINK